MRILLLGDYSNVHNTLARGLRELGHDVTVASNGDGWKNYPRDIDLKRKKLGFIGGLQFSCQNIKHLIKFADYDVVQLINPIVFDLKAKYNAWLFKLLRSRNRKIVLGAFGMDYYYVKACLDYKTFRYSDFNFGQQERISDENAIFKRDWLFGDKGKLNRIVAAQSDTIVAGLYEYYASYKAHFEDTQKLNFIPFPIVISTENEPFHRKKGAPLRVFIGIQKSRSAYKGTDIMLRAAQRVANDFPNACELNVAESVPFEQYVKMLDSSEVILDQLYSYTPAMNALEAMARGTIVVGGAEPESYALLGEDKLRPIINVQPNEQSVYDALKHLVENRDTLVPKLRAESRAYIAKHHDYLKVARQYAALYESLQTPSPPQQYLKE